MDETTQNQSNTAQAKVATGARHLRLISSADLSSAGGRTRGAQQFALVPLLVSWVRNTRRVNQEQAAERAPLGR